MKGRRWLAALSPAVLLGLGCSPLCAGSDSQCIELRIAGAGAYSELAVQWRYASAAQPIGAIIDGRLPGSGELPRSVQLKPPPQSVGALTDLGIRVRTADDQNIQMVGSIAVPAAGNGPQVLDVPLALRFRQAALTTAAAVQETAAADLDADGDIDLAMTLVSNVDAGGQQTKVNALTLWYQQPDGSFALSKQLNLPGTPHQAGFTVANLDGDARNLSDLAVSTFGLEIVLAKGDGTPLYGSGPLANIQLPAMSGLLALTHAQLDGKGSDDLAILYSAPTAPGQNLNLWGFEGGSYVRKGGPFAVGGLTNFIAAADFDGNGADDLVVANGGETGRGFTVFLSNGTWGMKSAIKTYTDIGADPMSIAIGDLNGDGRRDLVIASIWDQTLTTWLGGGDGTFTKSSITYLGTSFLGYLRIVAADFDQDGRLDIAVSDVQQPALTVLLGGGDGRLGPPLRIATDKPLQSLSVADLDANGRPDIIAPTVSSTSVLLFMNQPL